MRYVALLRGINVGGKNAVSMARLREVLEEAGHTGVRTYINSGNVIFDAPRQKVGDLAEQMEAAIEGEFGVTTRVLVLRGSTVVDIAAELPDDWVNGDDWRCDVLYLLPERASPKALESFELDPDPEKEEARYVPSAVLSRVARSHVNRSAVHKLTGKDLYAFVTIRNANTARKLAAMVQED